MIRGGSRVAAASKIERFVIIVNGFQPLTIITKRSILDVAAALDPPLMIELMMSITAGKFNYSSGSTSKGLRSEYLKILVKTC